MKTKYLRARDLKKLFNVSQPTLWRWVKSGKLPQPGYINNQRVWLESEIKEATTSLIARGMS